MKFEVVTLFEDYFSLSLRQSLLGKALEKRLFEIDIINPRDFATDRHHTVIGLGDGLKHPVNDMLRDRFGREQQAALFRLPCSYCVLAQDTD